MIEHHFTLNVIIVRRKFIMLQISPRRTMVYATELEVTISGLMIEEEEMIEGIIIM